MEIDDKGGEVEKLEQRYDHGISWATKDMFQGGDIKDGYRKGSNIKMDQEGSKFLNMRSTQVGGASS